MSATASSISITRPDDFHLHVRDGAGLRSVAPLSADVFKRAIIMPNLKQPVVRTAQALEYKRSIMEALPKHSDFEPLMTLYLTDKTAPEEVQAAKEAGIVAFKLYPAGATTNSDSGVTDVARCLPTLNAMAEAGMLLLVHGEVTSPEVDVFDREMVFIETVLRPLLEQLPNLKVVLEHITTQQAVEFVESAPANIAASITPQHMLFNRNALFQGGLQPHAYCLPVLKREKHRQAVFTAATNGNPKFFLGTDSAPHARETKEASCGCAGIFSAPIALQLYAQLFEDAGKLENLEGFSSFHGADFYGLPRNSDRIKLLRESWQVPGSYPYADTNVVPLLAEKMLRWRVARP
ncbi:dihydroorotase, homodimeric type [Coccomyxa subellipsoidea C-169]|uniref:Dihydroorotase, mitochondrial n=1 Tax=Coccomyxa subellipsoidea (strain C-169) TaxID=574566 RepID=I0Z6E2_COCSC|nr:dihydroorotase, homodimeric type [Coccomyxa subellipsoidea C-169]EIE26211.1 dihydroorotase, homodimeric type [Coccomyxa subellipsoidea C-169]|eukprot:XP_005650755.1 dihydroorotase, homodimeric type [Coccomyxa subellipsoidea C-169]